MRCSAVDNFPQFSRDLDRIMNAIPLVHRDAFADIVSQGYARAIDGTPRRSGALAAENIVVEGDPMFGQGRIIYESSSRIGPDAETPTTFDSVERPDPSAARAGLASVGAVFVCGVSESALLCAAHPRRG